MNDRARAHRARFQGYIKCAAGKPIVAGCLARSSKGEYLGVAGGIMSRNRGIAGFPQHHPIAYQHRPHGNLAGTLGTAGQLQGPPHPGKIFVGAHFSRWAIHSRLPRAMATNSSISAKATPYSHSIVAGGLPEIS